MVRTGAGEHIVDRKMVRRVDMRSRMQWHIDAIDHHSDPPGAAKHMAALPVG
jgi:Uri superfamily endonuclease